MALSHLIQLTVFKGIPMLQSHFISHTVDTSCTPPTCHKE